MQSPHPLFGSDMFGTTTTTTPNPYVDASQEQQQQQQQQQTEWESHAQDSSYQAPPAQLQPLATAGMHKRAVAFAQALMPHANTQHLALVCGSLVLLALIYNKSAARPAAPAIAALALGSLVFPLVAIALQALFLLSSGYAARARLAGDGLSDGSADAPAAEAVLLSTERVARRTAGRASTGRSRGAGGGDTDFVVSSVLASL